MNNGLKQNIEEAMRKNRAPKSIVIGQPIDSWISKLLHYKLTRGDAWFCFAANSPITIKVSSRLKSNVVEPIRDNLKNIF